MPRYLVIPSNTPQPRYFWKLRFFLTFLSLLFLFYLFLSRPFSSSLLCLHFCMPFPTISDHLWFTFPVPYALSFSFLFRPISNTLSFLVLPPLPSPFISPFIQRTLTMPLPTPEHGGVETGTSTATLATSLSQVNFSSSSFSLPQFFKSFLLPFVLLFPLFLLFSPFFPLSPSLHVLIPSPAWDFFK